MMETLDENFHADQRRSCSKSTDFNRLHDTQICIAM